MTPRVVFDTNIYISAFLYRGNPRTALHLAIAGRAQLLVSEPLKLELQRVLLDKFNFTEHQFDAITDPLWKHAEWIAPRRRLALCPDELENRVLECALEGNASLVITGDKHLLNLHPIHGLSILAPAAFLARLPVSPEEP